MEESVVDEGKDWAPFFYGWCSKDLSPQASRDLFALAVAGAWTQKGCVLSVDELAAMVGVGRRTMESRLSDLTSRGWITTTRRGRNQTSVRRLAFRAVESCRPARQHAAFVKLPASAVAFEGSVLRVAASIQRRQGAGTGWCVRTRAELGVDACVSPRSVTLALTRLRALGVLREGLKGRRVVWDCVSDELSTDEQQTSGEGATDFGRGSNGTRFLVKEEIPERFQRESSAGSSGSGRRRFRPNYTNRKIAKDHLERWSLTASPLECRLADELAGLPVIAQHEDPRERVAAVIAIASVFAERADQGPTVEELARAWAATEARNPQGAPLARFLGLAWAVAVPSVHDRRREPDAVKERFEAERRILHSGMPIRPRTPK